MLPLIYLMLNVINWNLNGLNNIVPSNASEHTYFVLPVASDGSLQGTSQSQETKFVFDVHAGGKKATFSIGGGSQDATAITNAVNNPVGLISNIVNHINQYGYDGVTLDIENTSIDPQKMADFINNLRVALPTSIIGVDVQNYQRTTVWSKLNQAVGSVNWVAPLLYDSGKFKINNFITNMGNWNLVVPSNKLMAGVAVNYSTGKGGLSTSDYSNVLDVVISKGWMGLEIWDNVLYTQPWINVTNNKVSIN